MVAVAPNIMRFPVSHVVEEKKLKAQTVRLAETLCFPIDEMQT